MDLPMPLSYRPFRLVAGVCLLALTVFAVMPSGVAADKQGRPHKESKRADTRELEGLETQWRDAMVKGDTVSLEKLLADDFFGISSNGTVSNKQQYLHRIAKRQTQFSQIELMDQKVRMQPTTAIVTSQARVIGELDGRPVDGVFRYTKVYGREAGGWRVVNFEATRVSGPNVDATEMHRGMPILPQAQVR